MKPSSKLGLRLLLSFVLSTAALAAVCIVALVRLVNVSVQTRAVVSQEVDLLHDAAAFDALLYQKGFVSNYMLSGDPVWLEKLEASRAEFSRWLERPSQPLEPAERALLDRIISESDAYDAAGRKAIDLFDAGRTAEAVAMIPKYHAHIDRLVELSQQFGNVARRDTEQSLVTAQRSISRLAWLLVVTGLVTAISSLVVGFLWAQRVGRPLYQLQLQIESAAERTKIRVSAPSANFDELTDQVAALVQKAEDADAALARQRHQLIQSEKMSAIGELAAKLAHEILNPLAGIKAAVQLLAMQAEARELEAGALRSTTQALEQEVTRIEQLIRRLIDYARPLAPDVQVCAVSAFVEAAQQAVERELPTARWQFELHEQPGIPPLEVDRILMTQVFVNLLRNAAEAMPNGGRIVTSVFLSDVRGRDEVHIEVQDEGSGLSREQLSTLFTPFWSTKPHGHGLGLATSRNIVIEHGGSLEPRNRSDGSGAIFRVALPLLR